MPTRQARRRSWITERSDRTAIATPDEVKRLDFGSCRTSPHLAWLMMAVGLLTLTTIGFFADPVRASARLVAKVIASAGRLEPRIPLS
jgi:hypothetical protein